MDFQRLLPNLEGVLAPAANKEILQIVYFLHKVVPAVLSHFAQVLVCLRIKHFGDSGLLTYTVSPLSSLSGTSCLQPSLLHPQQDVLTDSGYLWSLCRVQGLWCQVIYARGDSRVPTGL